ncbi:hypothetical protein [Paenibacillus polymyxa]|uniref:hypothetical protein n=1 Tax=Paenibacillus polymyxa TaxID=1406 RepID=UPI0006C5C7ED|nr:hypothetical protein [Paenibacillus polymyxa]KOS00601.1 hypothetical protein AM598_22010 [Paenibacillus polymyxa]
MTDKLYAIIDRETSEVVYDKTYKHVSHAKRALRYHFGRRLDRYGIGVIERSAKLALYVDENDKWTEVSASE